MFRLLIPFLFSISTLIASECYEQNKADFESKLVDSFHQALAEQGLKYELDTLKVSISLDGKFSSDLGRPYVRVKATAKTSSNNTVSLEPYSSDKYVDKSKRFMLVEMFEFQEDGEKFCGIETMTYNPGIVRLRDEFDSSFSKTWEMPAKYFSIYIKQ